MRFPTKRFAFRSHRLTIVLIVCSLLAFGLALGLLYRNESVSIRASQVENAKQQKKFDASITKLNKEKEARRLKAEKTRKLAAAKKAAEQAKHADKSTPTKISSTNCRINSSHANPNSIDVVVNKKNCITPLGFVPSDLVTTNGATISAKAAASFNALYAAAARAGLPFSVTSSYRSYATQISTYNYWVGVSGKNGADTYSARPGYSEHQTGLAVDVASGGCALNCFGTTSQYAWMQKNAASYGFVQRYYKGYESITGYSAEEWHYRFVGKAVALDMKAKGIKTLEQYWHVSGGDY